MPPLVTTISHDKNHLSWQFPRQVESDGATEHGGEPKGLAAPRPAHHTGRRRTPARARRSTGRRPGAPASAGSSCGDPPPGHTSDVLPFGRRGTATPLVTTISHDKNHLSWLIPTTSRIGRGHRARRRAATGGDGTRCGA